MHQVINGQEPSINGLCSVLIHFEVQHFRYNFTDEPSVVLNVVCTYGTVWNNHTRLITFHLLRYLILYGRSKLEALWFENSECH